MKLFAELAGGNKCEIKLTSGDVEQQMRQIRDDVGGVWIEAEDGSWVHVSQIARLAAVEEGAAPFVDAW